MRLFIAINLPENIRADIQRLLGADPALQKLQDFGRIIPDDNWHITLLFLGEIGAQPEKILIDNFENIFSDQKPIKVRLERFRLVSPKMHGMLWLSASHRTEMILEKIYFQTIKRLEESGISVKTAKKFKAHITLTRFKKPLPEKIKPDFTEFDPIDFKADKIDLMLSELSTQSAKYSIIKSVDLRRPF